MKIMRIQSAGLVFSLLLFIPRSSSLAQAIFERTYGGPDDDYGYSVQQTTDGGYIVTGITKSYGAGGKDVYLIKTDGAGDTLWTRTYGGSGYDFGWSVQQTTDGGYIIGGSTDSFGAGRQDVYLIRTDGSGGTVWTRTYGGSRDDYGYGVQQTTDGGYIIAGCTTSFGDIPDDTLGDLYLIKTDSIGDTLWTLIYGGDSRDGAQSVRQTNDGGYVAVGETWSFPGWESNVFLVITDGDGVLRYVRSYGGSGGETGGDVQLTSDGGFIVTGSTSSFMAPQGDVYLIKTDAEGDSLWTRTYGAGDIESGRSVQQTQDGGYIVVGSIYSQLAATGDAYLVRTDAFGDTLWTRRLGGESLDIGWSVDLTSDGGFIVTGETETHGDNYMDVYLVKIEDSPTGLHGDPEQTVLPQAFSLCQNFPNPCNPSTTIGYEIPVVPGEAGVRVAGAGDYEGSRGRKTWSESSESAGSVKVRLAIYDLRGRLVSKLVDQDREPGRYQAHWDGRDDRGARVSSGIYLYRIEAGEFVSARKMVLVR